MSKQAIVNSDDFNRIVSATRKFVSENSPSESYHYIKLEFCAASSQVTAIAADGYKMSVEHAACRCDTDMIACIHPGVRLPKKQDAVIEVTEQETVIRCGRFIFGSTAPKNENCFDWRKVLPDAPIFRIAFNPGYLLDALQAAKASNKGKPREPVILEFRSAIEPVIFRSREDNIKMVMPIKIKSLEDKS